MQDDNFEKGKCIKPFGCNECCKFFCIWVIGLREDELHRLQNLDTDKIEIKAVAPHTLDAENRKVEPNTSEITFKFPCKFLKDGKCSIYENRPLLCREYPLVPEDFEEECLKKEIEKR